MGLIINTTDIKLSYERIPSRLQIETKSARLELRHMQAEVNIRTETPRVLIDQYQCFAEAGLKGNYDLARENAQLGYNHVINYIGQTARDGNTLAAIEKGGNPIADIAVRRAYPVKQFNIAFIPKSRPKIDVTGNIDMRWQSNAEGVNNGIEGRFIQGDVMIDFTPARLNVFVKQYPSVKIDYENSIDIKI